MKNIQALLFCSLTFLSLSTKSFSNTSLDEKSWGSFLSSIESEVEVLASEAEHLAEEALEVAEEAEAMAIQVAPAVLPAAIELLTGKPIDINSAVKALEALSTINSKNPAALRSLQAVATNQAGLSLDSQNPAFGDLQTAGVILQDGHIRTPEIKQLITQALFSNQQTGEMMVRSLGEIQQDAIRQRTLRSMGSFFSNLATQAGHVFQDAATIAHHMASVLYTTALETFASGKPINLNTLEQIIESPEVIQALQTSVANEAGISIATQNALVANAQEVGDILADGVVTFPEATQLVTHVAQQIVAQITPASARSEVQDIIAGGTIAAPEITQLITTPLTFPN